MSASSMAERSAPVLLAAAAIANARDARRGAPKIANVLDVLPAKLRSEVEEDARAAVDAAFPAAAAGLAEDLAEVLDRVLDHVVVQCRPEASSRTHDVLVSEIIPAEIAEKVSELLLEMGR